MGQYHHPVCIEAEEGLNPHGMDSGLKEGEQGFSARHARVTGTAFCRKKSRRANIA